MIFLYPNFLIFMLIPLIILAYLILTNKKNLERVFSKEQIKRLVIKQNPFGTIGQNILLFLSLLLFIFALSRPVIPKKEISVSTKPIDIAILLDISNSMNAKDVYPDRLTFAKKKIIELLSKIKYANISLYAYSDNLFMIAPKTWDTNVLKYLIKNFNPSKKYRNSSNLYNALSHIKEKNIIIFTDGEHIEPIEKFEKLDKNLSFYIVATKKGAPIKVNSKYLTDKDGNIIISKPPKDIQKFGNVIYFSYSHDNFSKLFANITTVKYYDIKEKKELFYYPLALAILLLTINFFSLPKIPKFKFFIFLFFVITFPQKSNAFFFDFYHLYKAKKAYNEHKYHECIKEYKKVLKSNIHPELLYNLANCYYKVKDYHEALNIYKKINAKDKDLMYKKYFNMGNTYFMLKKYQKAYEYFLLAQNIKNTKKVKYNIKMTQKYIKKENPQIFYQKSIKPNFKREILKDLKQKSIMIPLTDKKVNDEISW